ncbi:MAG: phosphoglycerate dehydrogenase [Bacteroidetes bacterium]|nr:phosphoglycerate dehydrogenase [Bacteroidota bacterium]
MKVLLLENVHANASNAFTAEDVTLDLVRGALPEKELTEALADVEVLGIRSKTQITLPVLEHAPRLAAIGAYCVGTNQIDLHACSTHGVAVFNAPYSNTRSVVELAIGEMIMLIRRIVDRSVRLHQGIWEKSAGSSYELRGKKLGIIGYGNIGTQLSVLAEALGMEVYYYDVLDRLSLGNARQCGSLEELLAVADIVSIHVDGRDSNTEMIGAHEFALMKRGAIFLNLARGHLVHVPALVQALRSGHLGGAAVDVFPEEPTSNVEGFESELRGLPNTILTPHIGGSTEEAQADIGSYVSNKLRNYLKNGDTYGSVNFPELQLPAFEGAHRVAHVHANVPGVLSKINHVLAVHDANIVGQYLKTRDGIGYVITDIAMESTPEMIAELRAIEETMRLRILY